MPEEGATEGFQRRGSKHGVNLKADILEQTQLGHTTTKFKKGATLDHTYELLLLK